MNFFNPVYLWLYAPNSEDCRVCDHKVMVSRVRNEEMMNVTGSTQQVMAGDDPCVYWSVMDH